MRSLLLPLSGFIWPPQCLHNSSQSQNLQIRWQGGHTKRNMMQKRESDISGPRLHEKQAATAERCPGGSLELTFVCHWIISFHLSHSVLCVALSLYGEESCFLLHPCFVICIYRVNSEVTLPSLSRSALPSVLP